MKPPSTFCEYAWQSLSLLTDLPTDHLKAAWQLVLGDRAYKVVNTGRRLLHLPTPLVEEVQRQVLNRVLNSGPVSPAAYGGVAGRSFIDAARIHLRNNTKDVLSVDIKSAFETTFYSEVKRALRSRLKNDLWIMGADRREAADVVELLTFLLTVPKGLKTRRLPLGTSTSVALFNLVMLPVDQKIMTRYPTHQIRYSRYVDDLVFSSQESVPDDLEKCVYQSLRKHGLKLNPQKTQRQQAPNLTVHQLTLVEGRVVPSSAMLQRLAESYEGCTKRLSESKEDEDRYQRAVREHQGIFQFLLQFYGPNSVDWPEKVRSIAETTVPRSQERDLELLWMPI